MKSTPITQRAATRYGSAPKNQEVTVDAAGTTPAKFERMSPVKQIIKNTSFLPDDEDNGDINLGGGVPAGSNAGGDVFGDHGLGDSAGGFMGPSADFNKNPFFHRDGSPEPDKPSTPKSEEPKTMGQTLIDNAGELGASQNQSVEIDMTPIQKPEFISSGSGSTDNSGKFIGPYERRQRGRGVKISENQKRRQEMALARDIARGYDPETGKYDPSKKLEGKEKREFLKGKRIETRAKRKENIKAEYDRQSKSNVDAYKTKFRGSGDPAAASNKFKSIGTEVANTDFSIKRNSGKPSLTTKTTSSEQRIQNFRSLTGEDDKATLGSGVNKKASSPIYKMGGFGSKAYKK